MEAVGGNYYLPVKLASAVLQSRILAYSRTATDLELVFKCSGKFLGC